MSPILKELALPISILIEGPINSASVILRMKGQGIEYPSDAREYIETEWQERLRMGRSTRDTGETVFMGISRTPEGVVVLGSPSKFSERHGTGQRKFRERFGDQLVAKGIGVNSLILTADDYVLVGQRNTYRAGKEGGLHMVGGGLNASEDLQEALNREVREEAGIDPNEWTIENLLGITQSKETLAVDVNYFGRTLLTRVDIEARPTDGELGRVFYPDSSKETRKIFLGFLRTASSPVVASLYLYGKQNFGNEWAEEILDRVERMSRAFSKYNHHQADAHMHILANRLTGI